MRSIARRDRHRVATLRPQMHHRHLLRLTQLGHLTRSGIYDIWFASRWPTTGHTCRPMTLYISLASACRARVLLLFHALLWISLGQRSHGTEIGLRPRLQRHPQRLPTSQMGPARMRRCQICSASWEGVEPHDWEIPQIYVLFSFMFIICHFHVMLFYETNVCLFVLIM